MDYALAELVAPVVVVVPAARFSFVGTAVPSFSPALADFSLAVGVIVPLVVAVAALAIAAWRLSNQDID